MATIIVIALLLSIGAGLGGWGINRSNRWFPAWPLRLRLLIGSLTAPMAWVLFCTAIFAWTAWKRGPIGSGSHGPISELLPVLAAFVGLLGFSWAGGLARAWFAWREPHLGEASSKEPRKELASFFPFILIGVMPPIGLIAIVQIWREHGEVPDRMMLVGIGTAFALGYTSCLLSTLGLATYRLKNLSRPISLRVGHLALTLAIAPILIGLLSDAFATQALAQGVATLFGAAFAVGVLGHFLPYQSRMRARGSKLL